MGGLRWTRYRDDDRDTLAVTDCVNRKEFLEAAREWFERFVAVEYEPAKLKHDSVHGFMFRSDGVNGIVMVAAIREDKATISEYFYSLRLPKLFDLEPTKFDDHAWDIATDVIQCVEQDFFEAHRYYFSNDLGTVREIDL